MASVSTTGDEFDLSERERIRQALLAYMREHKIGTPTLAERIRKSHPREMEIPLKTLQRALGPLRSPKDPTKEPKGPTRTHDMALIICKAFVEKLPDKPLPFQALGQALYAIYRKQPDIKDGTYAVLAHDTTPISYLSVTAPAGQNFLMVKEMTTSGHSLYDGVMVCDGSSLFTILKDRLMHTARVHAMSLNPNSTRIKGVIYDNGNLESGDIRYQYV